MRENTKDIVQIHNLCHILINTPTNGYTTFIIKIQNIVCICVSHCSGRTTLSITYT